MKTALGPDTKSVRKVEIMGGWPRKLDPNANFSSSIELTMMTGIESGEEEKKRRRGGSNRETYTE